MIDALPRYVNRESRHGHNLSHDFSFTSSTGHLLTLFGARMDPKDTIQGRVDMFTRTQPLTQPANVEIEEFIDFFFVPLEMLYTGFGDYVYQVNEPYSSVTQAVLNTYRQSLPVLEWNEVIDKLKGYLFYTYGSGADTHLGINTNQDGRDWLAIDNAFLSVYRNLFHNYFNPNGLFKYVKDYNTTNETNYIYPADYFQPNVFPLYLLAYNCIYQHFYRLDDREQFNASTYNVDEALYRDGGFSRSLDIRAYSLHYRPRFFDYFTSAKVAPLINGNNIISGTGPTASDLVRVNNYLSSQQIFLANEQGSNISNTDHPDAARQTRLNGGLVSTAGLRSMFAVEKLLSISNRAKKTYDAQVMAHLGVDMPTDYFHNIQYIGTQKSTIKVGEVVSTASTEDSPLGDIAGKGYSVMGDKGVKFTAPCHGVFMAIYSAVPKVRYYAPLEKHAMITDRLSFYHPEFAQLGMQPIFGYEAFAAPTSSSSYTANSNVIGWQMRYDELKKRFNKVSPAFVDTVLWNETRPYDGIIQTFNDWHTWTVVQRPYNAIRNLSADIVTLKDYLAVPTMLNGLMASQYIDGEDWYSTYQGTGYYLFDSAQTAVEDRKSFAWDVSGLFKRDPLLHFAKIDFKIVNKIPDNTLPNLNVM